MALMVEGEVGSKRTQVLVCGTNVNKDVMIWAEIIDDEIVGPFLVPDGLKMNSGNYCAFLEENLMPWLNSQNDDVKQNIIFQQDNAPSHASRFTKG